VFLEAGQTSDRKGWRAAHDEGSPARFCAMTIHFYSTFALTGLPSSA
jgi:hypothetical protein